MVDVSITRVSSKGQIVIPQDMRENFKEGDKIIVIKNDNQIILKKMEHFEKNLEEDLDFARKTEESWKRIEQGDFACMKKEDFLNELVKW
jgi:AbrB family looped-hinge helix DNA binding protein